MKTVQKGNDIKRVKEDEAESLVRHKGYSYVPKSTYKSTKKEVVSEAQPEVESTGSTEESKSKKSKKKG